MKMYRGDYLPGHPNFGPNSQALAKDETTGANITPIDEKPIEYSKEDDKAIEDFNRRYGMSAFVPWIMCS